MELKELRPDQVDMVVLKTTSGGPFAEDFFYFIIGAGNMWQVPNSRFQEVSPLLDSLPDVDNIRIIEASGCTHDRVFVIWRKSGAPNFGDNAPMQLRARLERLLTRLGFSAAMAAAEMGKIMSAYATSARSYHDVHHLHHCLWELDQLPAERSCDRELIEVTIWYHDLVCVAGRKDNEKKSAEEFAHAFKGKWDASKIAKVVSLIEASTHQSPPASPDIDLATFLDIDMSVLGLAGLEFEAYEGGIREEYKEINSLLVTYYRKKFFKRLLSGKIYLSPHFSEKYEERARQNIRGLLSRSPYRWMPVF